MFIHSLEFICGRKKRKMHRNKLIKLKFRPQEDGKFIFRSPSQQPPFGPLLMDEISQTSGLAIKQKICSWESINNYLYIVEAGIF